ncbi:MAG: sulfite exporter TauE/SafE family protein [Fibrobacterota bacterium]
MASEILFLCLGLTGGFVSGLLGIGGALIIIPLLLYAPPCFGIAPLSMHEVSGLSMIQVFFAALSGSVRHWKNHTVSVGLLWRLGLPFSLSTMAGAVLSSAISGPHLTLVFGCLTLSAAFLMLFPRRKHRENDDTDAPVYSHAWLEVMSGISIGLISGLVGVGGGFILIPLMLHVLKVPLRTAVGTSLAIVLFGSVSGAVGKIATDQIAWLPALALVLGTIPAAQAGALVNATLPDQRLRQALFCVVVLTTLQVWYKILS